MEDQLVVKERELLPESFDSLEQAAEFWDIHSTADYEDLMEEVEFEINLSSRKRYNYAIAKELITQLREKARQQGISTQTLINLWLQEKLAQAI
jgi:predicted DNA binding CopG/RHH family protein